MWMACAARDDGGFGLDAGPLGGEGEAGDCPDAGCDEGPGDGCETLVAACCGETCAEAPACAAAQLLRDHEPERCADALTDTQTFPHCAFGNCDTLVDKVCGPENECPDAPGCTAAQTLRARAADEEATQEEIEAASSSCLQALEDENVFAPCN
jgi:hypothetical protein